MSPYSNVTPLTARASMGVAGSAVETSDLNKLANEADEKYEATP